MPMLDFPSAWVDDVQAATLPDVVLALAQDASPSEVDRVAAEALARMDWFYLLSVMCFPDDTAERERLKLAHDALWLRDGYDAFKQLKSNGFPIGDLVFDSTAFDICDGREDLQALMRGAIERDRGGATTAGIASGWMLRAVIGANASVGQAAAMVHEWSGPAWGGGIDNLKRHVWHRYRSVAHLWTALSLMIEVDCRPATPEWMILFCGTAQWVLDRGIETVPKHRRGGESVLDPATAWAVPPAFVQRMPSGEIGARVWNSDPRSHDIRGYRRPSRQLV